MSSESEVKHLHTYFLFPVAIDRAAVMEEHPEIWRESQPWFKKLDQWITGHVVSEYASVFSGGTVRHRHIQLATQLMADFHYFNNYWFHLEPTAKDEELEHFALLCDAYQLAPTKEKLEDQIDRTSGYIDRLYARRNNDAVKRLAMMSVVLGIGALVTGYYGMNIPHLATLLQNGATSVWSLVVTSLMAAASLWFIFYIVASNWLNYRASILPHRYRKAMKIVSLRGLRPYNEGNIKTCKKIRVRLRVRYEETKLCWRNVIVSQQIIDFIDWLIIEYVC